jgi:hypothetical protein
MLTDDDVPRWQTTRDCAVRNTFVLPAGHVFVGNPAAMGLRFGDYEPLNAAARI